MIRFPLDLPAAPVKVSRRRETWRKVILSGIAALALLLFIVYVVVPLMD